MFPSHLLILYIWVIIKNNMENMNKEIFFGAHAFLWIERWTSNALYLYTHAKELGLNCLEIPVGDDIFFDSKVIFNESKRTDIQTIISPGAEWPMQADISHPEKSFRDYGIQWHKDWINKGAEAGAKAYTGALYAHPGRIEKQAPDADEWKYAADNLHQIADFAEQYGMAIVIEPMSHFRTHLINTPKQAMNLIQDANHQNLSVLFDTYHMVTEIRNFKNAIELMSEKLWGVHACENDRGVPGGGLVPWGDVCNALNGASFSGYMILETYNSSISNGDFAYSRGMFHHVCDDGDAFVKRGIHFLKEKLNLK